jgi:hypothetical protein
MKLSEFISADNLTLHIKDNKPASNLLKGAKQIKVIKGEKIPEIFIPNFIKYNRDFIANLPMKDGIPQLTANQEKKYNLKFEVPKPKTEKEVVDKLYPKYDIENLNQRLARYIKKHKKQGNEKFKEWCEKTFGEDRIDRRKSCANLIVQILNWQDKGKL